MKRCVGCGSQALRQVERTDRYSVGQFIYTGRVPVLRCQKCGAEYATAEAQQAFERDIALNIVKRGPVHGEALRFLRIQLGLQAIELAKLLRVRSETLSRWENNRLPIDWNAWLVVGDLVRDKFSGTDDTLRRRRALDRPIRSKIVRLASA
jgi:DNA-binding XRE family transcriptional regulator